MMVLERRPLSMAGMIALGLGILPLFAAVVSVAIYARGIEAKADQALLASGKIEQIKVDQSKIRTGQALINERIRRIREDGEKRDENIKELLREIRMRNRDN